MDILFWNREIRLINLAIIHINLYNMAGGHRNHFSIWKISVFNGGSYMRQHSPGKTSLKFCQQPFMINELTVQILSCKLPQSCQVHSDFPEQPVSSMQKPHLGLLSQLTPLLLAYLSLPPPAPSLIIRVCSSWWETERNMPPQKPRGKPWAGHFITLEPQHSSCVKWP